MVYGTLVDSNVTTLSGLFVYIATNVPIFMPFLLFALFMITMLSIYFSQMRLRGYGDIFVAFAVAGYFTAIISIFLFMVPHLISSYVVIVTIVIAIIGTGILFSQQGNR